MSPRPGQMLGLWRVARAQPDGLVLEREPLGFRRVVGRGLVAAGAQAAALALFAWTPDGLGLVVYPVAVLLLVVAALAVPAAVRDARLARRGVALGFEPPLVRGTLASTGLFHDVGALEVTVPLAEVREVALLRAEHPPLQLTTLEVQLRDGRRLVGPEVAVPQGEPSPLDEVAAAARALLAPR